MLQGSEQLFFIGVVVIIVGIALIILGVIIAVQREGDGQITKRESKGIILIGPIPIVWGMGKQGWAVALVIAIAIFLLLLLF